MDNFVKLFFGQFEAPGLYCTNYGGQFQAAVSATLSVEGSAFNRTKNLDFRQTHTWLGKCEAKYSPGPSDLDGFSREYVTVDGALNMTAVYDILRVTSGISSATLSAHFAEFNTLNWHDNHVSLLVNMLRFTLLQDLKELAFEGDNVGWPEYYDGHVRINRNQFFGPEYPEEVGYAWPGGTTGENYPQYHYVSTYTPADDMNIIDLRGMNDADARFVLLMLGAWNRSSRYLLDFKSPLLTQTVAYRARRPIERLQDWFTDEQGVPPPRLPSADEAWGALMRYVAINRLQNQFSVALYLVAGVACRMLPSTAEGQAWLDDIWLLHIPEFRSCRARYGFFNEGLPVYLNHRAIREWAFVQPSRSRIYLISVLMAQAAQTGLASRHFKSADEEFATEMFLTQQMFSDVQNYFSVIMAEAVRQPVPLSGMMGAYITHTYMFEHLDKVREVRCLNETADVAGCALTVTPDMNAVPRRRRRTTVPTNIVDAELQPRDFEPDPDWVRPTVVVLRVPKLNYVGVPTFLLSLHHHAGQTPFSLSGIIDPSAAPDHKTLHGWVTSTHTAWTWPVLQVFTDIPTMVQGAVTYALQITSRQVMIEGEQKKILISDMGSVIRIGQPDTVQSNVPEGVKRLRGYIVRDQSGFRFCLDDTPPLE